MLFLLVLLYIDFKLQKSQHVIAFKAHFFSFKASPLTYIKVSIIIHLYCFYLINCGNQIKTNLNNKYVNSISLPYFYHIASYNHV